ncbi:MAG TPA: ABC transporter ATP-binding protein [Pyrinomonadaceae bacterium]|nr:ABC transporter ATP-binding protein [Pyrinomonadaceae bacterium]
MGFLSLQNISKRYGATRAVADVSLEVEAGEFFGLLGPSGCGKTTTLRMVAGLEAPDAGSIVLEGRDITRLPADRRGFGMVFQSYALFPHLNVFENVAFGLRARRLAGEEVSRRVAQALSMVSLSGYERRRVDELSGGQQQRVAIARAISIEPALLLFDEPLSNLDVALREETRTELRELVKRLKLTALYVTHDQEEAFALCDRISVMSEARILQTGTPRQLYEQPEEVRVARFLGRNNMMEAVRLSASHADASIFSTTTGSHRLRVASSVGANLPLNKPCTLAIRPEHLQLYGKIEPEGEAAENTLSARISSVSFSGSTTTIRLEAEGLSLEALVLQPDGFEPGAKVTVRLPPERITILK